MERGKRRKYGNAMEGVDAIHAMEHLSYLKQIRGRSKGEIKDGARLSARRLDFHVQPLDPTLSTLPYLSL